MIDSTLVRYVEFGVSSVCYARKPVALRTNGFKLGERLNHLSRHRLEHPWVDQYEYEECADEFLTKVLTPLMLECTRKNGDRIRYDTSTDEFGIISATDYIVTYFYRTNRGREYFERECRQ